MKDHVIECKRIDEIPVIVNSSRFQFDRKMMIIQQLLPTLKEFVEKNRINDTGKIFCRYKDFTPGGMTVDMGYLLDSSFEGKEGSIFGSKIEKGLYVTSIHNGHFDELLAVHKEIENWIETMNYTAKSVAYEIFQNDPFENPDPNEWKTEVLRLLKE